MTGPSERVGRLLAELAAEVAADAGAGLYLDAGEGTLDLVASAAVAPVASRLQRWLHQRPPDDRGRRMIVPVPDERGAAVVLERHGREEFSPGDRAVARLYARQLADDVKVGSLEPRTTVWTRQLEAIQAVAAQLTRLTTLEEVGQAICAETSRIIEYDNARVYVLNGDGVMLDPIAFRSTSPAYAGQTREALQVRVGEGITGWVAARGTPLIVADANTDPRAIDVPGTADLVAESMLVAPLRHEREVTGVIVLMRLGAGRFDDDDLRLLQILSDQAAVAVANARLLAARDRLVTELEALLDISQAAQTATDETSLAKLLAMKLARASEADGCVISRLDDASAALRVIGAFGVPAPAGDRNVLDLPVRRRVLRDALPAVIQLETAEPDDAEARAMAEAGARTLLLLPLVVGGRSIGLAELVSTTISRNFAAEELNALRTMASQAGTVLENVRLVEQLRLAADIDQVTGVNNHRYLQERLKQESARSARSHSPFSVLMVDLDGFKGINDKHGHADGDRVLRGVAAGLKLAVRTNDIVARYGGDEFVVLMPDTDDQQARAVAGRIVDGIRNRRHELSNGTTASISASAGLAVYPDDGLTPQHLLQAADAAMYSVKRAGGGDVRRSVHGARGRGARRPAEPVGH